MRTPAPGAPAEPEPERAPASPADARRRRQIDASLTRLTAAHDGIVLDRDTDEDDDLDDEHEQDDDSYDDDLDDEDLDDERPPDPHRRRTLAVRWTAVAVALLILVTAALGWAAKSWLDGRIRTVAALDPQSGAVVDAAAQAGAENVLLLGLDPGDNGSFVPGAGSDTITIVHVPASGGPITTLAFPRDLEINRPPCQRWDPAAAAYLPQTVPAETRTKIDSAFQAGGPSCAVRVVQQLTGLSITRFAAVDIGGFGGMVDALGGVSVCLDRPVVDGVLGPVATSAGTTTLDATRAVEVVRARHVQGEGEGEQGLVERQQRVFAALLDSALSTTVLLNPGEIKAFARAFGQATIADGVDIDELVSIASAVRGTASDPGLFVTVPTTGEINTRGNSVLRDRDAATLFKAVRTDAPIPAEAMALPTATATPAPSTVTLDVLNAADRSGLAGQVADTLRSLGFSVGETRNAATPAAETLIRFSPDRAAAAQVLAGAVPSARSVPDATASGVLQLVLGTSFDGTVRAAPQAGTTAAAAPAASAVHCE